MISGHFFQSIVTFFQLLSLTQNLGTDVPFHKNIIGNFIVYQSRIEKNLLKLCAHLENSE